ncbi:MAG: ribosome biogenesis GTPase Der [Kiritimatiellae bacterium]|nr:ribosome biogenesis GTPase Der [Kiritimatiellia bacterium]
MNEKATEKRRVVVIVGRPNVGKSAVFNRIAGKRIAIVHDESGVTRDRLMREVEWDGERFQLVDTGGVAILDAKSERNPIEAGIRVQVDSAVCDAAVAILVVDGQQGIHPMDEEVAGIVRKANIPCVVAVNKCDLYEQDKFAEEFASLGFPYFAVAAQHGRGFGELLDAVIPHLPPPVNETETKPLRVAVVGRPNAGKSSYINRLLNEERVIVSDVAGTTRDSIDIPFTIGKGKQARHYTLIDTAGMRNRHKVDSAVERFSLFRAEESVKQADVVVLVMTPEIGPTVQDKHICGLITKERKGCVILMNKWDLAMEKEIDKEKADPVIRQMMPFMSYCPLLFISSKTGLNVRKSIDVIDTVAANTRTILPTGMLNRTLVEATQRVVAPSKLGKRLRVYYAVQVCTSPITIRMFVNDAKLATTTYTNFMIRSLREKFGLEGAPIVIFYRTRSRPEAVETRHEAYVQAKMAEARKGGRKGKGRRGDR